jgi:hypothetical protein
MLNFKVLIHCYFIINRINALKVTIRINLQIVLFHNFLNFFLRIAFVAEPYASPPYLSVLRTIIRCILIRFC